MAVKKKEVNQDARSVGQSYSMRCSGLVSRDGSGDRRGRGWGEGERGRLG